MSGARRSIVGVVAVACLLASCSADSTGDGAATTAPAATASTAITTTTDSVPPLPPLTVAAAADAAPGAATQPDQPTAGPGGSAYPHHDWTVSSGGTGADAWYVFEPADPAPASAPVAIMLHGYYEYEGYASLHELIRHTVRSGSIVVYPRWQTDVATPCPGPFDVEPCVASALAGIEGALDHLTSDPSRVQPQLDQADYFGFSFGGIITANLTNRYEQLGLPEPRAIFLEDPHDGGMDGKDEPALDRPLSGIPTTARVVCHSSAQGVLIDPAMANGSCNAVFPLLGHIPAANKDLVMIRPDDHGSPALGAYHGVCSAREGQADAYDWNFCWRTWDVLRDDDATATERRSAHGPGAEHTDLGAWSDGTPITPLVVSDGSPLVGGA